MVKHMIPLTVLVCVAGVNAFPAFFLAYNTVQNDEGRPGLLDCLPTLFGYRNSYRCQSMVQRGQHSHVKSHRPAAAALEVYEEENIVSETPEGFTILEFEEDIVLPKKRPVSPIRQAERKVVVMMEEPEIDPSFVITVPEVIEITPKCEKDETYASEIDLCVKRADHVIPPNEAAVLGQQDTPRPVSSTPDPYQPARVIRVGHLPKKICPPGEIMVYEIGICMPY